MASTEQVLDLVRAHYRRDETAFRNAALRFAAAIRDPAARERARRCVPGPQAGLSAMPAEAKGLLWAVQGRPLEAVRLPDALRDEVDVFLEEQERADELEQHALSPRRRLLLHGEPGNGKTTLAGAIAVELQLPCMVLRLGAVASQHIGEEQQKLTAALQAASGRCVLLLDEIDAIASTRSGNDLQAAAKEQAKTVCVLLQLLDEDPGERILIGATNRVDLIDPAVRRRFELELELPAPTSEDVAVFAEELFARHKTPPAPFQVRGAVNYDSVEKAVVEKVRRIVLFGGDA
jgi:SpoVK/Ycf46/Vps4 family AAA+-type ATPase